MSKPVRPFDPSVPTDARGGNALRQNEKGILQRFRNCISLRHQLDRLSRRQSDELETVSKAEDVPYAKSEQRKKKTQNEEGYPVHWSRLGPSLSSRLPNGGMIVNVGSEELVYTYPAKIIYNHGTFVKPAEKQSASHKKKNKWNTKKKLRSVRNNDTSESEAENLQNPKAEHEDGGKKTLQDANASKKGTEKLLSDFKDLLESGNGSDVTFQVQGQVFRLHRDVLAARTPVFRSMFEHDMQEKATGVVTVVDCEAGPFRTFVQYLYTGSTDGMCTESVFGLYRIADKYQVDALKASCLIYMKNSLSVDTFCETLDLALQYEEEHLVERVTKFLSKNASDIVRREDWQVRLKSNTKEMCEYLGQALEKRKAAKEDKRARRDRLELRRTKKNAEALKK